MGAHVDDLLPELALETLASVERARAEGHVATCDRCRRELAAMTETLAGGWARLPLAVAAGDVQRRILEAVNGALRFAPFTRRVAKLLAVDEATAAAALERIAVDPSVWSPWEGFVAPGFDVSPAPLGPSLQGGLAAFVRVQPGFHFPRHRHIGDESLLIMQGLFNDGGVNAGPGDFVFRADGNEHEYHIPGDEPCIAAHYSAGAIELL